MGKLRSSLRKIYGVTQWVALVEQELYTFLEHLSCIPSHPHRFFLRWYRFAQSLFFCVIFCGSLFTVYIHYDSFPIKSAFLPPFRIRKRFHSNFWFIFTTDGEYVLSIYLLIAIFSDWKHRWRNTIYIQEIEIRSYVISLGDKDFIFSAQKIFVTHLRNTKKENFKNVMFLG
jgi:hypothetical protein